MGLTNPVPPTNDNHALYRTQFYSPFVLVLLYASKWQFVIHDMLQTYLDLKQSHLDSVLRILVLHHA